MASVVAEGRGPLCRTACAAVWEEELSRGGRQEGETGFSIRLRPPPLARRQQRGFNAVVRWADGEPLRVAP